MKTKLFETNKQNENEEKTKGKKNSQLSTFVHCALKRKAVHSIDHIPDSVSSEEENELVAPEGGVLGSAVVQTKRLSIQQEKN